MPKSTGFINDTFLQDFWNHSYEDFIKIMNNTEFGSLVFDFDGTLCDMQNRYAEISNEVVFELVKLLSNCIPIGIATGRGKSIKQVLKIGLPRDSWDDVYIGYYNGSDLGLLSDDEHPIIDGSLNSDLLRIKENIKSNPILNYQAILEFRPNQILIQPKDYKFKENIHSIVFDILANIDFSNLKAVVSSHSIDIVPLSVTKKNVINICKNHLLQNNHPGEVLCFGDQGEWPGNDYDLLSHPFSLSVNTVSPNPKTCWNLSPRGYYGEKALVYYLKKLLISEKSVKVKFIL